MVDASRRRRAAGWLAGVFALTLTIPALAEPVPSIVMAANNADLGALATTDAPNGLQRCGYLLPGDSPCLPMQPSASACSLTAFTGTVTTPTVPSNQLNVTVAVNGSLRPGLVMPAGIFEAGTIISSQLSGTPGGAGVYQLSQPFNPPPSFTLTVKGDGGTQVPSADGKCWTGQATNPLQFGADPTGANDSSAALTAIFALGNNQAVFFPVGTYRITCGHSFVAAGALSLMGAGKGMTTIKFDPGCTPTGDFFAWTDKTPVIIKDITFDFNTPAPATYAAGLAFYVDGANQLIAPKFVNSEVLNWGAPIDSSSAVYGIRWTVLNSNAAWLYPVISGSRVTMTNPSPNANECVVWGGTGAFDSVSLGNLHNGYATDNVLVGCGFQHDGDNGYVSGNDISGFGYGTGIYVTATIAYPNPDFQNIFANNNIHDSPAGYDKDDTVQACVEENGHQNVWIGNTLHGCGGEGIRNDGENNVIQGGAVYDNAKTTVIHANYKRAGIAADAASRTHYNSKSLTINNVSIYDSGGGTQLYAYADDFGVEAPVSVTGAISGATAAILQNSVQGTLVGDVWQVQSANPTCGSGTLTSSTSILRYQKQPFKVNYTLAVVIVTNGSCATDIIVSLPFAADPGANSFDYTSFGLNESTGSTPLYGFISHTSPSQITLRTTGGLYPGADNTVLTVSGSYPVVQ